MSSKHRPTVEEAVRLEGMVVQKRLGRVETTRYLVLDLTSGTLYIYRHPPPDIAAVRNRKKSAGSRIKSSLSSLVNSNAMIGVTELDNLHLTHINRERRPNPKQRRQSKIQEMRGDSWEPKFVVPSHVDWKIR